MNEKLLKPYDPLETEKRIYSMWEESGCFNPDRCIEKGATQPDAKPFTLMMPPPNVTGILHMGHAMFLSLQDIMVRYKRMQGFRTLWLPGTDHAAIATQSKVEKEIWKKEGLNRHDLGREEMYRRIEEFAKQSHDTIVSQVKVMGASCDWSREAFTLDEQRNLAVNTLFKRMYDDGLIYRGHHIVNWDPKGQTTIADDEIVYEERKSKLYTFKYSKDFPIAVSTTRPETKVGDVAVAVHPDDDRYHKYIGQEFVIENFCGVKITIKIIADRIVESDFGTGALGVTPAHSIIDWEIADRHELPRPQVINEYAKMMVGDERLMGKKTTEARETIVEWLRGEGLLEAEEEITQNVSTAERTGGIIEPLPKLQWFIAVNKEIPGRGKTLKEIMREPVANADIKIIPEYFDKTYFHWIDNLRDWCISRQIWYGHRIPVWYNKAGELILPKEVSILLARHGQCECNVSTLMSSQQEADVSPLTELGREQAKNLGESLRGKGITKVVCSKMRRSQETAMIAANSLGLPESAVEIWEDLHEVDFPDELAGQPKPKDYNPLSVSVEHGIGEPLDALEMRAKNLIKKFADAGTKDKILAIGHGSINSTIRAVLAGMPKEKFVEHRRNTGLPKNCSFVELHMMVNPLGEDLKRDEDTLDTWFSAGSWTFSTLGWPNSTDDLTMYHPTDVLETGYEILFFWVARMILMTGYALETIPFHTVYLHGTVRDGLGRKMSKSLGNGIDPLVIAEKFGADAGRMALVVGTAPGTDSKISEDKIKGYKHFSNKIWNIARFVLGKTAGESIFSSQMSDTELRAKITDTEDLKYIAELDALIKEITVEMDDHKYYIVAEKVYHYIWHIFADKIIENTKPRLLGSDDSSRISALSTLYYLLLTSLKILHPFMPFVTEEIWSFLPHNKESLLIVEPWPCNH